MLAKAVNSVMTEMLENKTEIADWKTMKFLRGHCFNQSGYDRKKDLNQNFELSVTMAVRLAIMTYDNSNEFQITIIFDEKNISYLSLPYKYKD